MTGPFEGSRRIVLASASRRRRDLLEQAGFAVTVVPSGASEDWPPGVEPEEAVTLLALRKLRVVRKDVPDSCVLAADTEVVLDGEALGKPATREEAESMLRRLSGRRHLVYSGVALGCGSLESSGVAEAEVEFPNLGRAEIAAYLDRGEYGDKAGGYGIQDKGGPARLVRGRMDTVMGLPLDLVERLWRQMATQTA